MQKHDVFGKIMMLYLHGYNGPSEETCRKYRNTDKKKLTITETQPQ